MQLRSLIEKLRGLEFPTLHFPGVFFVFPERRRFDEPKPESEASIENPPALVLDTSAIIDGRIADIIETGFIEGTFVLPTSILQELQRIADSENKLKRNRGRRGLDILDNLKKSKTLPFVVIDCETKENEETDASLLRCAREIKGKVITTDYNLNKVAKVSGVPILNVNELANMVKTIVLPGEYLTVKIIQEGKEKKQGVAYLPDGTMVVVEKGKDCIGEEVKVKVKRLLQTEAGRMIFAKMV